MVLSIMMKKVAFSTKETNSRLECKNHTLFETKMAKSDILFLTKTVENIAHIREYLPSGPGSTYL